MTLPVVPVPVSTPVPIPVPVTPDTTVIGDLSIGLPISLLTNVSTRIYDLLPEGSNLETIPVSRLFGLQ